MSAESPPKAAAFTIRPLARTDESQWAAMRHALWPDCPPETSAREMRAILADANQAVFVADAGDGRLCGFAEMSIRTHAEGCVTQRVGYLEGWYVSPEMRRHGVGAALVAAGEAWAREHGCLEMASDADLNNSISATAHAALGYQDAGCSRHFFKKL
jgi:aminoglycoside 6'-N-acetyltransferase I